MIGNPLIKVEVEMPYYEWSRLMVLVFSAWSKVTRDENKYLMQRWHDTWSCLTAAEAKATGEGQKVFCGHWVRKGKGKSKRWKWKEGVTK